MSGFTVEAQLIIVCPIYMMLGSNLFHPHQLGVVVQAYNRHSQDVRGGGSEIQGGNGTDNVFMSDKKSARNWND